MSTKSSEELKSPPIYPKSGKMIYIVDDEPDISELVSLNLNKSGFSSKQFDNGESFFAAMKEITPDLIILDVMLELGADDYVTKPFSPRELVARVKAILRREGKETPTGKLKIGNNVIIDLQKYEVYVDAKKVDLTSSEFKILKLLADKKGWVYSREQILDFLGANDKGVLDRTVDVHIKNLREKLGSSGRLIKNIRGVGYKLED